MPHRFIRYERADIGEERWAIWSTIVDDFTWYDMTDEELVEHYAEQERKHAEEHARERIEQLRSGEHPYRGGTPDEDDMERLRNHDIE